MSGVDQCITIFNDVESYIDGDKYFSGGNEFSENINRLIWNETSWFLSPPKQTTGRVFAEIWTDNKDNKDNENQDKEKHILYHTSYEILDEVVSRTRLEYVEIGRKVRKSVKPNLGFVEAFFYRKETTQITNQMRRSSLPICREMMFMIRVAVEAFELHIQNHAAPGFHLTNSPLDKLSKSQSARHVRGRELRKIVASIDELKTAVALKYFSYETKLRELANWWKLNDSCENQVNLVRSGLEQSASFDELAAQFGVFKSILEGLRTKYKEVTNSDFKMREHEEKTTIKHQSVGKVV